MAIRNKQVLDHFASGYRQHEHNFTNNLRSEQGKFLFNYDSLIAINKKGKIYINNRYDHFSKTTQVHINYLKRVYNAELVSINIFDNMHD